jgi:hypothetical protein
MKTATVVAVMYVVVVLVIVTPIALIVAVAVPQTSGGFGAAGTSAGVLLFGAFGALLYGVGGWIFTAIACALYNLVAGWIGGIEVQVEAVPPPPPVPTWGPVTQNPPGPPSAPPAG